MARPKEFDESLVLERALETFWAQGYERTSISDLEATTGLGRQSLYNAFGDKHSLYLRVLDRYTAEVGDLIADTLLSPPGGAPAIRAYLEAQIAFLTAPAPTRKSCLVVNAVQEFGGQDPAVRTRCHGSIRSLTSALGHALRAGVSAGTLPHDLDIDGTARMLQAHSYGLAVLAKDGASAAELRSATDALLRSLSG